MVVTVKYKDCRGWTLIEILVVVFIIGIASTFVTLSLGQRGQDQQVEKIAQRLTQVISFAQTQALLQSTTLGLRISNEGYGFLQWSMDQLSNREDWAPAKESILSFHAVPVNVKLQLKQQGDPIEKTVPQLVISSNGDITPFEIDIGTKGKLPVYQILGNANGSINMIKLKSIN